MAGVMMTVHYMDKSTDVVHLGCEEHTSYWTWFISDDRQWLIFRRFEGMGIPRTQVPMVSIRAIVLSPCEPMPPAEPPVKLVPDPAEEPVSG